MTVHVIDYCPAMQSGEHLWSNTTPDGLQECLWCYQKRVALNVETRTSDSSEGEPR